jgi:hypothetical protein
VKATQGAGDVICVDLDKLLGAAEACKASAASYDLVSEAVIENLLHECMSLPSLYRSSRWMSYCQGLFMKLNYFCIVLRVSLFMFSLAALSESETGIKTDSNVGISIDVEKHFSRARAFMARGDYASVKIEFEAVLRFDNLPYGSHQQVELYARMAREYEQGIGYCLLRI